MTGRRRWPVLIAAVAAGAGLAALAGGGGALRGGVAAMAPGGMPRLPARPTIVSVNPCTDAILAEVADPGQIRALSAYSRDPAQASMDVGVARRFAVTGGTVEEILALRPDVVLGGGFTPPATRATLARLGIAVVDVGMADDLPAAIAQVRAVAALAGQAARGEALVARMRRAVADAAPGGRARAAEEPGRARPMALIRESDGMIAGSGTLVVDLARRAGLGDGAARLGLRQAAMPGLEPIVARPPAVMIVVARGDGPRWAGERMLAGRALGGMRLARLDPALVWCGGPTVIRAAARLAAIRREIVGPAATAGERDRAAPRGGRAGGLGMAARVAAPAAERRPARPDAVGRQLAAGDAAPAEAGLGAGGGARRAMVAGGPGASAASAGRPLRDIPAHPITVADPGGGRRARA